MMASGSDVNQYAVFVEECEGLDKLERLQNHPNKDIYKKSLQMLRTYFETDELVIADQLFPDYPWTRADFFILLRILAWNRKHRLDSSRSAVRIFPAPDSSSLKFSKIDQISVFSLETQIEDPNLVL